MISGGIVLNYFTDIGFISEAKIGDDRLGLLVDWLGLDDNI